jgi:hypothetical protein
MNYYITPDQNVIVTWNDDNQPAHLRLVPDNSVSGFPEGCTACDRRLLGHAMGVSICQLVSCQTFLAQGRVYKLMEPRPALPFFQPEPGFRPTPLVQTSEDYQHVVVWRDRPNVFQFVERSGVRPDAVCANCAFTCDEFCLSVPCCAPVSVVLDAPPRLDGRRGIFTQIA